MEPPIKESSSQKIQSKERGAVSTVVKNILKEHPNPYKKNNNGDQQKQKTSDLPQANELVLEFLKNYQPEITIKTLKDALKVKKLPENKNDFGTFCDQLYDITKHSIAFGIDIPKKSAKWVIRKLILLRELLWEYVIMHYDSIWSYTLQQLSSNANTISVVFYINSHLLIILEQIVISVKNTPEAGKYTTENTTRPRINIDELMNLEVVPYPKKQVESLTMMELQNTIHALAVKWFSMGYNQIIKDYLSNLEARAAHIISSRGNKNYMDGKDNRDRIPIIVQQKEEQQMNDGGQQVQSKKQDPTYSCTNEYVSDIATIITKMKQSMHYVELHKNCVVDITNEEYWEGYRINELHEEFLVWLKAEAAMLQGAKFKDDVRSILLKKVALRLGDLERFTRNNAGIPNGDAGTVIDDLRTPIQATWWTNHMAQGGIPKILASRDLYIRSITVARIFHRYCDTWLKFDWWNMCLFLEDRVRTELDKLRICDAPGIIQQIGEYNIWFHDEIFRTVTMERAIILWIILMNTKRDCIFKTGLGKKFDLYLLKSLLIRLNQKDVERQKLSKTMRNETDDMSTDEDGNTNKITSSIIPENNKQLSMEDIFCEVYNPIVT